MEKPDALFGPVISFPTSPTSVLASDGRSPDLGMKLTGLSRNLPSADAMFPLHEVVIPKPFQDLPNAMNAAEITDKLGLHSLRNRNWYIQVRKLTLL